MFDKRFSINARITLTDAGNHTRGEYEDTTILTHIAHWSRNVTLIMLVK
jgi:hypothetical protein